MLSRDLSQVIQRQREEVEGIEKVRYELRIVPKPR